MNRLLDELPPGLVLLLHDLKNPLAVIQANLALLEDLPAVRSDSTALDCIEDSNRAAQRLQRMLINLVDLARLEAEALPLRRSPGDLRALVRQAVSEAVRLGRSRGVRVVADLPASPVAGSADLELLRRALDNLIENGIRYARSHGTVTVRLAARAWEVVLEVADDGPGIPEALAPRIFEKFVQADLPAGRPNRGLGLTFVRLVAQAHGGEVTVESPPRGGSVFRLRFPRRAPRQGAGAQNAESIALQKS